MTLDATAAIHFPSPEAEAVTSFFSLVCFRLDCAAIEPEILRERERISTTITTAGDENDGYVDEVNVKPILRA